MRYIALILAITSIWRFCNSQNDESSNSYPPQEILQMVEAPEETKIDWKAMNDSNSSTSRNSGSSSCMATRRRRLGECAQKGDDCAPSRWNVLKLVVDGAYMSIRRYHQLVIWCYLKFPLYQHLSVHEVELTFLKDKKQSQRNQTVDVLIGTNFPSSDENILIDFPLGNNNIFAKTGKTAPIGTSFQNFIMTQSGIAQAVPLNTWTCQLTFAFSDGMTNQIMAAGNYFNQTRSSSPRLQNPPKFQIISIVGGTGILNRIKGFVILTPLDLTARPPKWWYYIV